MCSQRSAEVAVDALLGHPLAQPAEALGSRGPVRLGPARPIRRRGRRGEVGWVRPLRRADAGEAAVASSIRVSGS